MYFPCYLVSTGRVVLKPRKQSDRDIPVASGTARHSNFGIPDMDNACLDRAQVNFSIKDDPAALGCTENKSPDLPMPCDR